MNSGTDRAVRRGAIAITLTLILIVTTTAAAIMFPPGREWVRQRMRWAPPTFETGRASDLPPSMYQNAEVTVLIFATANCAACQRALAFHQELARAGGDGRLQTRVLMTSPSDDTVAYAQTLGLPTERVTHFDATGTPLRHVPTILIVDRRGIVREKKEGVLPADEQHALMETIKNLR